MVLNTALLLINDQNLMTELTIIILCYKSEEFVIEYLHKVQISLSNSSINNYEIILVGNYIDATSDKTPEIIRKLAAQHINVSALTLKKPNNGWLGWDVRQAFTKATGQYVAFIDGDGQMPADDIVRCFYASKEKNADISMTYRESRGDGIYRKLLSFSYNLMMKILFPKIKIQDINSKPKVIKRSLLLNLDLRSNGWTIDAEIILQAYKKKASIEEMPTQFKGLPGGRKSFVGIKAVFEFFIFILHKRLLGSD